MLAENLLPMQRRSRMALVYFDDNAAQNAVDQFIPKDRAKAFRDAKTHGQVKPLSSPLYDKLPNQ